MTRFFADHSKHFVDFSKPQNLLFLTLHHQTLDFRISRVPVTAVPAAANVDGATNFSVQLVMSDGSLSSSIKLCSYAVVDGPVGGYDPVANSSGDVIGGNPSLRPVLQTVRVPLTGFTGANLSQIRGIKIVFDESSIGSVYLANLRFIR